MLLGGLCIDISKGNAYLLIITHCSVVRNTAECVFIFSYHGMFIFSTKPINKWHSIGKFFYIVVLIKT